MNREEIWLLCELAWKPKRKVKRTLDAASESKKMFRCSKYVGAYERRLLLYVCNCMWQMRHLQCVNVGLMSQNSLRLHSWVFSWQWTQSINGFWTCSWTRCFLKMHSDQLLSDLTTHHLFSAVWGSYVTKSVAKRISSKDRRVHESAKCRVTSGCQTWICGLLDRFS